MTGLLQSLTRYNDRWRVLQCGVQVTPKALKGAWGWAQELSAAGQSYSMWGCCWVEKRAVAASGDPCSMQQMGTRALCEAVAR